MHISAVVENLEHEPPTESAHIDYRLQTWNMGQHMELFPGLSKHVGWTFFMCFLHEGRTGVSVGFCGNAVNQ